MTLIPPYPSWPHPGGWWEPVPCRERRRAVMWPAGPPRALQLLHREELVFVCFTFHWFQDIGAIFKCNKSPVEEEIRKKIYNFKRSFLFMAKALVLMREEIQGEKPIYLYSQVFNWEGHFWATCLHGFILQMFWKQVWEMFCFKYFTVKSWLCLASMCFFF